MRTQQGTTAAWATVLPHSSAWGGGPLPGVTTPLTLITVVVPQPAPAIRATGVHLGMPADTGLAAWTRARAGAEAGAITCCQGITADSARPLLNAAFRALTSAGSVIRPLVSLTRATSSRPPADTTR